MSTCTATIKVGTETVHCENDAPCIDHEAFWPTGVRDDVDWEPTLAIQWDDQAPGATPARSRYTLQNLSGDVEVWDGLPGEAARLVASFNKRHHPDPYGGAQREAERLNRAHQGVGVVRPPDPPPAPPGRKIA